MSFEMQYDGQGNPIQAVNIEVIQEPMPEPEEVVELPIEEVQEDPKPEVELPQETPEIPSEAPKHPSIEYNVVAMRNQIKESERIRKELEAKLAAQQPKQQELDEDALVEGRHLSVIERKIKEMQDKIDSYERYSTESQVERELKNEHPDLDAVLSVENIDKLTELYPEIAHTLDSSTDLRSKCKTAYTMIKSLGIHKESNPRVNGDRIQAMKNAAKPKPSASITPQQSTSPLSQVHNLTRDTELTPALQSELERQMLEAIRRG